MSRNLNYKLVCSNILYYVNLFMLSISYIVYVNELPKMHL